MLFLGLEDLRREASGTSGSEEESEEDDDEEGTGEEAATRDGAVEELSVMTSTSFSFSLPFPLLVPLEAIGSGEGAWSDSIGEGRRSSPALVETSSIDPGIDSSSSSISMSKSSVA